MASPATPQTEAAPENGASAAAVLSASLGLLALGVVQVASEVSEPFKNNMQRLGSAWIPGAGGIGPYSGKETVMLLVWVGSWVALYFALRGRSLDFRRWFGASMGLLAVALLLVWPPVWALFE